MYAIVFDLDPLCLGECYEGDSCHRAYKQVRDVLTSNGFSHAQGGVYFGDETIDAVKCVLVVQKLSETYPWFSTCVKDMRMLRIEESNDLRPAIL